MWIVDFVSRVGFFISYVLTFFLVLEVVRLVCTDASKREAEKLLDAYARGRQQEKKQEESCKVSVEELEHDLETYTVVQEQAQSPETPQRRTQRAVPQHTPVSHRMLVGEEKEKRKRSQTPTRRLRKRSDTLTSTGTSDSSRSKTSTGSSESRRSSRSHRDSSPTSSTSKSSSRHASPGVRRIKDAQGASLSLHRLLKQKV